MNQFQTRQMTDLCPVTWRATFTCSVRGLNAAPQ